MGRAATVQKMIEVGVVPIVRVNSEEVALRVCEAVLEAGVKTIEVTFTVPRAAQVIETLRDRYPELMVGAGTVHDAAAARQAVDAGAQYILSAGLVPEVISTGHLYGLPVVPGVFTATEAIRALQLGADILKLFPASLGGPKYLKALRAPMPQATWCPTGGVALENLHEWARAGAAMIGVGSPLLQDVAETGDYQGLTRRAKQFLEGWHAARQQA